VTPEWKGTRGHVITRTAAVIPLPDLEPRLYNPLTQPPISAADCLQEYIKIGSSNKNIAGILKNELGGNDI
jgi:hypothetical protein